MKKLYWSAVFWTAFGLFFGVFYREFTKAHDFTGESQLAFVHTHSLALGMIMTLVFIALNVGLRFDKEKLFTPFFWIYNSGLLYMVSMLTWHGIYQVLGKEWSSQMSMIAGLSHIILTVALIQFLMLLFRSLRRNNLID